MKQTSLKYSNYLLSTVLCGAFLLASEPVVFACAPQSGQSNSGQSNSDQSSSSQSSTSQSSTGQQKDPLPEAPDPQAAQDQQQPAQAPSGAAGAKAAEVKGAPVAQPSGAAVAPVKQRGHRSLLIKLGLIAAAGGAIGAAVALSEKSPARPPGTSPAAR